MHKYTATEEVSRPNSTCVDRIKSAWTGWQSAAKPEGFEVFELWLGLGGVKSAPTQAHMFLGVTLLEL